MVRTYSIYEAKAKLSELLRLVKLGNEVLVSERGQPVAKIIPFKLAATFEEHWNQLRMTGQIVEAQEEPHFHLGRQKQGALKKFLNDRD